MLEHSEQELQTAVADDEAAAPLHPHLRLDHGAAEILRKVDTARAVEGLVYPDFEQALVEQDEAPAGRPVGGIDFGWRNPFAAIWGYLDHDDVLWIEQERYLRETPVSDHAAALPRSVMWYADPAGATEIAEFRRAGLLVRRGDNNIRRGIALISARIRDGRLKVSPACVNLIAEARLYRYPSPAEREQVGENPIDAHNHALAALRYLVSRISKTAPSDKPAAPAKKLSLLDDDARWTPI